MNSKDNDSTRNLGRVLDDVKNILRDHVDYLRREHDRAGETLPVNSRTRQIAESEIDGMIMGIEYALTRIALEHRKAIAESVLYPFDSPDTSL